jgi:hypothetical protein
MQVNAAGDWSDEGCTPVSKDFSGTSLSRCNGDVKWRIQQGEYTYQAQSGHCTEILYVKQSISRLKSKEIDRIRKKCKEQKKKKAGFTRSHT